MKSNKASGETGFGNNRQLRKETKFVSMDEGIFGFFSLGKSYGCLE
jgi:hypothetical protein